MVRLGEQKNASYLAALLPGMESCIAVRVQRAEIFSEQMQDWQSRGMELHVISCPEAHGEYGPYHFAESMEDFQK